MPCNSFLGGIFLVILSFSYPPQSPLTKLLKWVGVEVVKYLSVKVFKCFNYTLSVKVLVFHHEINFVRDIHHNYIIGLKVTAISLTTSGFVHTLFFLKVLVHLFRKKDWCYYPHTARDLETPLY